MSKDMLNKLSPERRERIRKAAARLIKKELRKRERENNKQRVRSSRIKNQAVRW